MATERRAGFSRRFQAAALALALLHNAGAAGAESLELLASRAALDFDGTRVAGLQLTDAGVVAPAPPGAAPMSAISAGLADAALLKKAAQQDPFQADAQGIWGPGDVPIGGGFPFGIGPVSRSKRPGYVKGLLGSLLTLILAPLALALEFAQAVVLTPVRMARGVLKGDWTAVLEPVRTAKNLVQDAVMTAGGLLNAAAGPVWNALRPNDATDFQYANNRLIFRGGPVGSIHRAMGWGAFAPSWHTVFLSGAGAGSGVFEHEFVHNRQWSKSFLWEKVCEDYRGCKTFDKKDAHKYLNW